MACVLKIVGLVNGQPSEFDHQFIQKYDPTFVEVDGIYDGGILEVCEDSRNALQFPSVKEALECYNQSFGLRPDGLPNKPLSAFTVLVEPAATVALARGVGEGQVGIE